MRGAYREVLVGHAGLGKYLSGVILHEETLEQVRRERGGESGVRVCVARAGA